VANDQLDGDGEPLDPGSKTTWSCTVSSPRSLCCRARFLADEAQSCVDPESVAVLQSVKAVAFPSLAQQRGTRFGSPRSARSSKGAARARAATLDELADKKPALAAKVKDFQRWTSAGQSWPRREAADLRGLLDGSEAVPPKTKNKHQMGVQDALFANALAPLSAEAHDLRRSLPAPAHTLAALARPALETIMRR